MTIVNSDLDHIDGFQTLNESNITIARDHWYNAGCQAVFFDPTSGTMQGARIYDNMFFGGARGCGSSSQGLLIGNSDGAFGGHWQILYNTFYDAPFVVYTSGDGVRGTFADGASLELVGNLFGMGYEFNSLGGTRTSGCFSYFEDGSRLTPAFVKNVVPRGTPQCGADSTGRPTFASTAAATPNLNLSPPTQRGITSDGESSHCGPGTTVRVDINDTQRPSTRCTIGADEGT